MIFEGPEKKLEIVIKEGTPSLREMPKSFWHKLVSKAKAQVMSEVSTNLCDAYLLSESSLFVFDHRFIMITCGTTTLGKAAIHFLNTINEQDVLAVFYQRKNENFPHMQKTSFFQDLGELRKIYPGQVYQFGEADEHHMFLYAYARPEFKAISGDVTLEVLMHGIQGNAKETFFLQSLTPERVKEFGIRDIFADYKVDDFIFSPHGYSINAIKEDKYFTFHITPQDLGSYVSFETNAALDSQSVAQVIEKVTGLFSPRSFDVILFEPQSVTQLENQINLPQHLLINKVEGVLQSEYQLQFYNYRERLSSKAKAPLNLTGEFQT